MRAIHIHLHRRTADAEGQWKTIHGARVFIEGGKIMKGPKELVGKTESEHREAGASAAAEKQSKLLAGADAIAAMSDDKRDNMELGEFPGGADAYNLYEARTMVPKPSDKLKRVTDDNSFSLWQNYDYIANVDGVHVGVTKQEDPDEPDDDSKFIYSFNLLRDGMLRDVNTVTDDKVELFKEIRAHLSKEGKT